MSEYAFLHKVSVVFYAPSKSIATHSPHSPNMAWGMGVARALLPGSIWPGRHPNHPCPKKTGKKLTIHLLRKINSLNFDSNAMKI